MKDATGIRWWKIPCILLLWIAPWMVLSSMVEKRKGRFGKGWGTPGTHHHQAWHFRGNYQVNCLGNWGNRTIDKRHLELLTAGNYENLTSERAFIKAWDTYQKGKPLFNFLYFADPFASVLIYAVCTWFFICIFIVSGRPLICPDFIWWSIMLAKKSR